MKSTFSKFLYLFNRREKLQILALLVLILMGGLFETFGVGLIYPFISILKNPEIVQDYRVLRWFYAFMGMGSSKEFLVWSVAGLTACYLLKNMFFIFLAYIQSKFLYNKQVVFSRRLFSSYLNQPTNQSTLLLLTMDPTQLPAIRSNARTGGRVDAVYRVAC